MNPSFSEVGANQGEGRESPLGAELNPSRTERLVVEFSLPDERLDVYLRSRYAMVSRGTIQRLIEDGHIRVNGKIVKPTYHPRAGDDVLIYFPEARPAVAQPEDIPLDILFEDRDLLVLNKPPGLVTHPGNGHEEHTLVNALLHHCRGKLSGIGGVARPGIVHRLDKDTSGCLVVAKNDTAHLGLTRQFAARTVGKIYLAIVCGVVPRTGGDIRAPITRHPTHRKRMVATEDDGREAWTSYQVREHLNATTLVEAHLHTGRTHQIRVHFLYLGHPLLGDEIYGKKTGARIIEMTGYTPPRQLLHAHKLAFTHPRTGKLVKIVAPRPRDFQEALRTLRQPSK